MKVIQLSVLNGVLQIMDMSDYTPFMRSDYSIEFTVTLNGNAVEVPAYNAFADTTIQVPITDGDGIYQVTAAYTVGPDPETITEVLVVRDALDALCTTLETALVDSFCGAANPEEEYVKFQKVKLSKEALDLAIAIPDYEAVGCILSWVEDATKDCDCGC